MIGGLRMTSGCKEHGKGRPRSGCNCGGRRPRWVHRNITGGTLQPTLLADLAHVPPIPLARPVRQVRPRLRALRFPEVRALPSSDRRPQLLDGAGGESPEGGWNPSMDDEREDHWEVELGFVVATRVHEEKRMRSYQPERRDLPAGLFLKDFLDRRESFINPVNNREEAQRGQCRFFFWRDVWLREGWVGSSRFWVRPRRRIVVLQSGRPLTDQERQNEMDEDGAGGPVTAWLEKSSEAAFTLSWT